jgi:hypothetical protein
MLFSNPEQIGYIKLKTDSEKVYGYTKFFIKGIYRVAVPALQTVNTGDIYIPHVVSDANWSTGIALVNTGSEEKSLAIEFNTNHTVIVTLPAGGHMAFTITSLFGGEVPEGIRSAVIKAADGIIGLELFGSQQASGANYLSGILITDRTESDLYIPHLASDNDWWTGIVAYNASTTPCDLKIKAYAANGTYLGEETATLQAQDKYEGAISQLDIGENGAAWLKMEASAEGEDTECGITGFELFGTNNGRQLAGYSAAGIRASSGILPKLEPSSEGFTGIAMINTEFSRATVTLTAYNDAGTALETRDLTLESRSKIVALAADLFETGDDISGATYVQYESTTQLVTFQLNSSLDGMLLDGLPGMSTN